METHRFGKVGKEKTGFKYILQLETTIAARKENSLEILQQI